jgi:acyl carrier protein
MADSRQHIRTELREFVLKEFLPGEAQENLEDSTPLIAGAIVDSIGVMKLVLFVQERFGVEIEPHEMNAEYMGTISHLVDIVESRRSPE